ncbi:MAG: hydroxyphenylacetyl-CoA thioesterase PaaI [Hyphomonadaceae bacterium]
MSEADALARRVAENMWRREGTSAAWGVAIEGARLGYSKLSMRVRADMLNGHDAAHGGIVFALADTAFAYACNSRNEITVGHYASITYLSAANEGEILIAEASETARVGRTGTYSVSVRTSDGRPIAEFAGTSRTIGGDYLAAQTEKD